MKADLTRLTFDATKHYRAVQQQQGRVQLDSDWNEQNDIAAHRVETETLDVVGPFGAPMHDDGFRLVAKPADLTADEAARAENKNPPAVAGADLLITGGRFYAGGVLAENDRICLASAQPDWPTPAELAKLGAVPLFPLTAAGTYLAYLDVWPRLRTAMDDPHIREVALGGPDTATRARNAWQVKFLPAPDGADCATPLPAWDTLLDPQPGTLAASVAKVSSKPSPCIVDPGSGYRRLENQLYRVEVHQGGASLAQASFKWSRDNGSVVTKWLGQNALGEITVESTGRDKVLNLTPAQWVELTDDVHEELGLPGVFAQIASVNGDVLTLTAPVAAMDFAHFPRNPKVRRWDSAPASPGKWITPDGNGVNLNTTDQFELEDGVVVKFGAGSFRAGDYWLIPARTALPQVDWPTTGPANAPVPVRQPPHGVEHQYCRLAVVQFKGGVFTITDCRSLFPPLTELTSLFYVSGESQEATPDPTQPAATLLPLTLPLKVGVANGEWPVVGARVRFTVIAGGGALNPASGIVLTGADGIASCTWSINATVTNPEVIAELLDAGGKRLGEPVIFHARLNTARQVAYDPANCVGMRNAKPPVVTVQAALDFLCRAQADVDCCVTIGRIGEQRGDYDTVAEALEDLLTKRGLRAACLSLLPGDHVLDHDLLITPPDEKRGTFFKLAGCSHAARLIVQAPLVFRRLAAVVVRDISILVDGGRVDFDACLEVEVSNCLVRGRATDTALFNLSANRRVAFDGNQIAAAAPAKPAAPGRILGLLPRLSKAFEALDDQDFEIQAAAAAAELAQLPPKDRAALAKQLAEAVKAPDTGLDAASRKGYAEMLRTLGAGRATANTLLNRFKAIRAVAAAQAAPVGLALAVLDSVTDLTLMDNQVQGTISLGGQPASAPLSRDELKLLSDLKNREAIQFAPTAGNIRLRGNSLQQLGPGEAALADLRSLIHAQKGTLNLQGAMQLSDNVIVQGGNFFSACHVSLVATCFLETRADLGVVLASSATHVGSSAENDVPLFNLSVRPPGLAANVGLAIVVL
jgi:hypothetical protein